MDITTQAVTKCAHGIHGEHGADVKVNVALLFKDDSVDAKVAFQAKETVSVTPKNTNVVLNQ